MLKRLALAALAALAALVVLPACEGAPSCGQVSSGSFSSGGLASGEVVGAVPPGTGPTYTGPAATAILSFESDASDSQGNWTGTPTETGITYVAGKVGNAASFNGTTSIITWPVASVGNWATGGASYSFVAWMRPASAGENNQGRIWSKGELLITYCEATDGSNTGLGSIWFGGWSVAPISFTGTIIPYDTWTHIGVVYDGTAKNFTLYINGSEAAVTSNSGTGTGTADSGNNLDIGNNAATTHAFDGLIDEMHFFIGEKLTAAHISQLYTDMGGT